MAVTQTTDALLLVEIADNDCVILKYHTDECGEPCNQLVPVYHKLSDETRYKDIQFLQINADSNPVAKRFILDKKAPIITIYFKGRLLESKTVNTEEEMENLLQLLTNEKLKVKPN
jgi:thioredoxin 1